MAATRSATSVSGSGPSVITAPPRRATAARTCCTSGRRGVGRHVPTSSSGSWRIEAASWCQTTSDASSAHCRSSMTSTTGAAAHSSSTSVTRTSTPAADASPPASRLCCRLRSRSAARARRGSGEPGRTCRQSSITRSGSRSVSWSAIPQPTSQPGPASARASATSDDLPMPGSPSTQTTDPGRRGGRRRRPQDRELLRAAHPLRDPAGRPHELAYSAPTARRRAQPSD